MIIQAAWTYFFINTVLLYSTLCNIHVCDVCMSCVQEIKITSEWIILIRSMCTPLHINILPWPRLTPVVGQQKKWHWWHWSKLNKYEGPLSKAVDLPVEIWPAPVQHQPCPTEAKDSWSWSARDSCQSASEASGSCPASAPASSGSLWHKHVMVKSEKHERHVEWW